MPSKTNRLGGSSDNIPSAVRGGCYLWRNQCRFSEEVRTMFSGIDAIVLFGGAVLLGVSLTTALLALKRSSRREKRQPKM